MMASRLSLSLCKRVRKGITSSCQTAFKPNLSIVRHTTQGNPESFTKVSDDEKGIRTIQLNDPKKRNALSLNMLRTLHGNLSTGVDDLRVIILSSDGPVWSAGHDLKELTSRQDALLHGLISRVVPDDQLDNEARKIAERICETSREVVALGKATFHAQMNLERREAYRLTSAVMVENLSLEDGQEGIKAFIEKRKPSWSHRNKKVH